MKERKFFLNNIYFYLTEGCNLCCRHCWIAPQYQGGSDPYPYLSVELFSSIIKQAKPLGLSGVKLTGGEPLLHPQIQEILGEIQASELRLTVETNGLLCTEGLAREIAACKNPFVSVSLDGSDAEAHEWIRGVKGSFEKALQGTRNLVKAGLKPQIIMTIMRRNKGQVEDMVRLAEDLGAGSVKFNLLQPVARGEEMHKAGETLSIEELVEVGEWVENVLSHSTNLRLYYSYPLAFRPLSKMFGNNGDGCRVCGILGILGVLADGSYALCGIGETVPEFVFGDAATEYLEDVWNNTPFLQELREGLPERLKGICEECLMKGCCLGSCVAQNYYRSKSLWSPFWFCEQAQSQGLFPESRLQPREKARAKKEV
ncbi:SynChlorMet cassette radical SAM/SPASM protein ScmF [candidate division NPL-UPA2 bacterium]|nr:SynChlorMet cassette radical SAM/SPASM protein ScmF [candidate division NPL-UPA2 bacterium]